MNSICFTFMLTHVIMESKIPWDSFVTSNCKSCFAFSRELSFEVFHIVGKIQRAIYFFLSVQHTSIRSVCLERVKTTGADAPLEERLWCVWAAENSSGRGEMMREPKSLSGPLSRFIISIQKLWRCRLMPNLSKHSLPLFFLLHSRAHAFFWCCVESPKTSAKHNKNI